MNEDDDNSVSGTLSLDGAGLHRTKSSGVIYRSQNTVTYSPRVKTTFKKKIIAALDKEWINIPCATENLINYSKESAKALSSASSPDVYEPLETMNICHGSPSWTSRSQDDIHGVSQYPDVQRTKAKNWMKFLTFVTILLFTIATLKTFIF